VPKLCLIALLVAGTSEPAVVPVSPPAPAKSVTPAEAQAAYDGKQWATCADLYLALAEREQGKRKELSLYNGACCHALAGKPDLAFATLERAVEAGMRDLEHVAKDTDLASLHSDARWPKLIAAIEQRVAAWEKSLGAPELRRELLAMVAEDQAARTAWIAKRDDKALGEKVAEVDRRTTARMKEIVARHGWPGTPLVGDDGEHAAWLLVQHADADLAFQKQCLTLIEPLVARGEAGATSHAYLYDRVAVAEKRPQRFGTQFGPDGEPLPIEDEANVDARREAIGLSSMAEYRKQMRARYGDSKK
jgi:hypothetical protein